MFSQKVRNFIVKLQGLSDEQKKAILLAIVIIFGLLLGLWWIASSAKIIDRGSKDAKFSSLPFLDIPELETLKKVGDEVKNTIENIETMPPVVIEDWKVYENEAYGYQIKYPPSWIFREYPDTKTGAGFRPSDAPDEIAYEFVNINGGDRGSKYCDIPFSEYVKTAFAKEVGSVNQTLNSIEEVDNVNQVKMYKTTWNSIAPATGKKIIVGPITYFGSGKKDCKSYQAVLDSNDYTDVYEQMISTFKFTK
ncbi:MAG: hypothetical protein EXS52_02380 [Candidatus Staskawiczbacteria bacterium]|nr:hypothetical protein [Candidatus Staskawiczbacteria bacterium]